MPIEFMNRNRSARAESSGRRSEFQIIKVEMTRHPAGVEVRNRPALQSVVQQEVQHGPFRVIKFAVHLTHFKHAPIQPASISTLKAKRCVIITNMSVNLTSESVNALIEHLLLTGAAATASEAEEMFLDAHLPELTQLVAELDDTALAQHDAIKLLMSHGSRRWEDALP
jgi:hypothetical protein